MVGRFLNIVSHGMRSQCGASLVEYALLMALVPAIGMIAFDAGGRTVLSTFQRLGTEVPSDHNAQVAAASLRADAPAAATLAASPAQPGSWRDLLALGTVLCLSISLIVQRRTGKAKQDDAEEADADAVATNDPAGPLFDKRQRIFRYLTNNTQAIFNSQVAVRHVMTPQPRTVLPTMPRHEIQSMFREQRVHHALVCDDREQFVGVISDRDVLSRSGKTAGDIMTADPLAVTSDTTLGTALTLMLNHRISCVPVVDGGRLSGVYTTTDVILALQCTMQALERVGKLGRGQADPEMELEGTLQLLSTLVGRSEEGLTAGMPLAQD